jgi:hypothetical protein
MRYNTLVQYPDYRFYENGTIVSYKSGEPKQLKPSINSDGYYVVCIQNKYKQREYKGLHVLIARAFIPNPEGKPQVNHKDLDKLNCHESNLEWMTQKENLRHARDFRRRKFAEKYS